MNFKNITIEKNTFLLAYKLLHDALFLALATLAGVLFADGLLPGILTSKIGFSKIIFTIIILLATIAYLGKNLQLIHDQAKIHKGRLLPALVLLSFLLIGNSLLKFTFWENIIITLAMLFVFFLLYELIFIAEAE
jgi:hypothetical protein